MSILIKGMEMPKDKAIGLVICSSGNVYYDHLEFAGEAISVPPHGRLIDGDIAEVISFEEADAEGKDFVDGVLYAADFISQMPTIIEAEEAHNGE